MDALYFRVSSDRQTTENQFEDLLQATEKAAPVGATGTQSEALSLVASTKSGTGTASVQVRCTRFCTDLRRRVISDRPRSLPDGRGARVNRATPRGRSALQAAKTKIRDLFLEVVGSR
jgi:hypothetical protein